MVVSNYKIFIAALLVVMASCRYEEGPLISFESPEGRLTGYWQLEKIYKDGIQLPVIKCPTDTTNNFQRHNKSLYFMSGNLIDAGGQILPYCRFRGIWKLKDNKKTIEIMFDKFGCDYPLNSKLCDSTFVVPVVIEFKILRLTRHYDSVEKKNDLWVEEKRNDGLYEFHFK